MFISFYFPVTDFRKVAPQLRRNIRGPKWHNQVPNQRIHEFQPNLGTIRARPKGGLRGWVQEGKICEVRKSIRLEDPTEIFEKKTEHQRRRFSLLRFYYDADCCGYFSISFSVPKKLLSRHDRDKMLSDLGGFISKLSNISLVSKKLKLNAPIGAAQEALHSIYTNGSFNLKRSGALKKSVESPVYIGKPIIFIECSEEDWTSLIFSYVWPNITAPKPVYFSLCDNEVQIGFLKEDVLPFNIVFIFYKRNKNEFHVRTSRLLLSRLLCELHLVEKSVDYLNSTSACEIDDLGIDIIANRVNSALSRIYGRKSLSFAKNPEFYENYTSIFKKTDYMSDLDAYAYALDILKARPNLRKAFYDSIMWSRAAEENHLEIVKEKIMGSKYENHGNVGAMGENASASSFQNNQAADQLKIEITPVLLSELASVRQALIADGSRDGAIAAGSIAEAENAGEGKDHAGLMDALKSAGKWSLETATKIGATVAAAAIKKAIGL